MLPLRGLAARTGTTSGTGREESSGMIYAGIVLAIVVLVVSLDFLVRGIFRFPKRPHRRSPVDAGIPFEELRFPTRDGRRLYGWRIPGPRAGADPEPAPTLILVHGWGRNVERMMRYIEELHPRGYDLLAFDLRGHGSSDPDRYPNMLKFSEDIRAAVDLLEERSDGRLPPVGVVGLSVGGAAAIHAAAMDGRIGHVATVGAFAHPVDAMRAEFERRRVPYFPLVWLLMRYLELRMGLDFDRWMEGHSDDQIRQRW